MTDIAGTTRDVLSETVSLGRVTLRLSDTAGLRETEDPVERIGVTRAQNALDEAELVLALFDGASPATKEDIQLLRTLQDMTRQGKQIVYILTKKDLWQEQEQPPFGTPETATGLGFMPFSAASGYGMETLTSVVEELFIDGSLDTGASAIVFSARQHTALTQGYAALTRAIDALSGYLPYDLCAEDIRDALAALGELSGHSVREEVISEIFHKFCVGK